METVPGYVSAVFIVTTFAAIAFLLQAAKAAGLQTLPSKILLFILPLWIVFQSVLAFGGFYQITDPPRLPLFGVAPAVVLIAIYFLAFRESFIDRMPVKLLTLLHTVRIPVEITLYWLFGAGLIPKVMTFEGWNYDIVSGILAVGVYIAVRIGSKYDRSILIAFNIIGLLLLINIVTIAVLSLPTAMQRLAFDQPNRAVLYFPYIFLPTIVVPIVLFSHLAGLYKSLRGKLN